MEDPLAPFAGLLEDDTDVVQVCILLFFFLFHAISPLPPLSKLWLSFWFGLAVEPQVSVCASCSI